MFTGQFYPHIGRLGTIVSTSDLTSVNTCQE